MKPTFLLYRFFKTYEVWWCSEGNDASATGRSGTRTALKTIAVILGITKKS